MVNNSNRLIRHRQLPSYQNSGRSYFIWIIMKIVIILIFRSMDLQGLVELTGSRRCASNCTAPCRANTSCLYVVNNDIFLFCPLSLKKNACKWFVIIQVLFFILITQIINPISLNRYCCLKDRREK